MKKASCLIITIMFMFYVTSSTVVLADVPTVQNIKAVKEGSDTVLEIDIRHSSPSASHYIDKIEVEVNERLDLIDNLEPQTSTTFTYRYNIGNVQYETIRVRAHCNVHGWSSWANIEARPEPPFYETPLGITLIAGASIAIIVILIILRKQGKI